MLLETKYLEDNDFIIYSRNSTDEAYNFRIVFKNDPDKYNRIITYSQVRNFVEEYFPKNLIAYRILSNFPDLIISSRYGCTILLEKEPELVFTDPVFAVKTIEEYIDDNRSVEFRFKVQKVGYSSIGEYKDKSNFKEEFCYDLNISEVINQNDETFAAALLQTKEYSVDENQSKTELKRNIIFTPEQKSLSTSSGTHVTSGVAPIKVNTTILKSRYNRFDDSVTMVGEKKLNLDEKQWEEVKNKQIEFSFEKEKRKKTLVNQTRISLRNTQQKVRINKRQEGLPQKESIEVDSGINDRNEYLLQNIEFRKVQSLPPLKIRKVEINRSGSEIEITKKEPRDTLFTTFLENLKSEEPAQFKVENENKNSDILKLFKLVHLSKSGKNVNDTRQVILKTKGKKK